MHIYVIIRRDHVNNNGKNIGGALALWGWMMHQFPDSI
jgi:hypothetical protein